MLSHLLPIAGKAVVHRVITGLAVPGVDAGAFRVVELAPGVGPRRGACGDLAGSVHGVPPSGELCLLPALTGWSC
jgi:hypothetical protein